MGRVTIPVTNMGSEFALQPNQLHLASSAVAAEVSYEPAEVAAITPPVISLKPPRDFTPPSEAAPLSTKPPARLLNAFHNHSLIAFAILFLIVAGAGIEVAGRYWSIHAINAVKPVAAFHPSTQTIAGLNLTVPVSQLQSQLHTITAQPASLTVGTQAVPISPDTIRSWLQITASADKSKDYIHIKADTMATSLTALANQQVKAPVNQVTVNEDGVNQVVVGGRNGTALSDPGTLKTQASQTAKSVMNGKGLQFNTPVQTAAFQAVTPAAFGKLLVANVTAKKMWAFQNGQQVNAWLTSDGKPSTPTPLGEFHIYAKYAVQDMSGTNPDGTPYFQPRVPWVNYFSDGSAVHGVYWHPLSWFGAINSSHGCVGLPVDEAQWVYNWAPIGTTVITHA